MVPAIWSVHGQPVEDVMTTARSLILTAHEVRAALRENLDN